MLFDDMEFGTYDRAERNARNMCCDPIGKPPGSS